ncbi:glycerol-3-phosphate acyltransferase [Bhargavaea beijingensis]|uniref:Glycerol-3-phosphate acyltransferase n=1 Tax=Bhargavaea beijingensis TaxID=426756 RepID=A0A1G6YUR3_9BACL|nr:glycerol-3-phosphate acyltransferase [Bhargavaea beijingensis]MCW1928690.1 glycerol-3-phosphate acyltransferase [Bhargavaea beijingensis]RSK36599.1 glycerol-3-phosphate acyltransferase [Bhargavaea beijingensis]SDD94060.1 glycerol-3-phosphate acyltransferase PlsY [Bhargavaea beijingensis]
MPEQLGWLWIAIAVGAGYLIGNIHGSTIAGRMSGVNLKETGVKNAGASNAAIVLGKKYGALVAAIDIGKGIAAVLLAKWVAEAIGLGPAAGATLVFAMAAATIFGHNFPFHMRFNGGKGTATVIGVLLGFDWRIGLIGLALLILVSLATDFLVFGVLMLYVTFTVTAVFLAPGIGPDLIAVGLFAMAAWKHIENFRRMRAGEEKRVSAVFRKKRAA